MYLLSLSEIENRLERPRYINLLKQQLAKDLFVLENHTEALNECDDFSSIFNFLATVLKSNIECNKTGLMSFLYRVDVGEEKIKKALLSQIGSADELLAEMVMKRELQKILLREKYS